MKTITKKTIGEIVAEDYRTAEVFKSFGIDFCCGGKISIEEASAKNNVDSNKVHAELEKLKNTDYAYSYKFNDWGLEFLCDYIVNTHHIKVRELLPRLSTYTKKIAAVHGENHTELIEVAAIFNEVYNELVTHMQREEEELFPAIKDILHNDNQTSREIIESEINKMSLEHEFVGDALASINKLTKGYVVPKDACNTYMVTLKLLEEFENDLHIHVHLENNILFPKSLTIK